MEKIVIKMPKFSYFLRKAKNPLLLQVPKPKTFRPKKGKGRKYNRASEKRSPHD